MENLFAAIIGYLCGSIPFGLLLARAAGLGDIRKIGSGNIGATNVLRTGNKKIAALTLLCDVLKGLIPVLVGHALSGPNGAILGGFAALAGHIFPVWLKFKGGKGVATALGILLGWSWPVAIVGITTWVLVFLARRISSLSALAASVVAIPASYFIDADDKAPNTWNFGITLWPFVLILALVIWVTHRSNIRRLLKSEEPKSSFSKSP
jgi:acyl phosphate:glycerol-3-phosphate acyltransferase